MIEPPLHQALDLPAPLTLRLFSNRTPLFSSEKHWLHPLFDLEAFLAQEGRSPAGTLLVDRVTGRAAAFLLARLGIPQLRTGILSRRALPVLKRHGIAFQALEMVDRIACATEDQLLDVEDGETAYLLLQERRARAGARS
jgi:zinc transport system ATP-binding protein